MNLVLVGYRGSGKTTVARHLAQRLSWPWVDSDQEVERGAGQSIATLFGEKGEAAFRDLETRALADLATRSEHILAMGGGVVVRPENRQLLRQLGQVVWLTARPETLWQRVSEDAQSSRPPLTALSGLDEIRQVLAERAIFYREVSDFQIDTDGKTPLAVAEEILARISLVPPPTEE